MTYSKNDWKSHSFAADTTLERIDALVAFGRLDEAATECGNAIASEPDNADLWAKLAEIELDRDRPDDAERAALEANRLAPQALPALWWLIRLYLDQSRTEEARNCAYECLRRNPNSSSAYLAVGAAEALAAKGNFKACEFARSHAYRAVELDPDNANVLYAAAVILRDSGYRNEATMLMQRGLALAPTDRDLLVLRADLGEGSDSGAVGVISSILAENPEDSAVAWVMRETIWLRRRYVAALAVWSIVALGVPLAFLVLLGTNVRNLISLNGIRKSAPAGEFRRSWAATPRMRFATILAVVCMPWPAWVLLGHGLAAGLPFLGLLVAELAIVVAARADERTFEPRLNSRYLRTVAEEQRTAVNRMWPRIAFGCVALLAALGFFLGYFLGNGSEPAFLLGLAGVAVGVALAFGVPPIVLWVYARERERAVSSGSRESTTRVVSVISGSAIVLSALAAVATCVSFWLDLPS